MIVDRITKLLRRRRAANVLKVAFTRGASFLLPDSVCLNGQMRRIHLPIEHGVKVAFVELLLDDCYGCGLLSGRGESIRTVLDIGGNVGLFGVAARRFFPDAKIHCYEPNRKLEEYLSVQAKAAGFDYFMAAVGLEEGMISLDFADESVLTRSRTDTIGDVPQITFSKAIERLGGAVDLLKLDCEGAEWEIFADAESWRKVRHVAMEYHLFDPGHSEQAVKDRIADLGFRITSLIPSDSYGLLLATREGSS